jgi:hypothetical protein
MDGNPVRAGFFFLISRHGRAGHQQLRQFHFQPGALPEVARGARYRMAE